MAERVKPRWYERIRNDIFERDEKCKLEGLNYVAAVHSDPFSYRSFESYRDAHEPKHFGFRPCKLRVRDHVSKRTDRLNRFYKDDIRYEKECKKVNGTWDRDAINRINKYSKGVCWTSEDHSKCAAKTSVNLIIPDRIKEVVDMQGTINENRIKCETDWEQKCKWDAKIKDCVAPNPVVASVVVAKQSLDPKKVSRPPDNIPKDLTSEESQIQNYLFDWYTKGTPSTAPSTDDLIGTGNRCGGPAEPELANVASPLAIPTPDKDKLVLDHLYTKDELQKLKFPLHGAERAIMRSAIGQPNVDKWSDLQRRLKAEQDNGRRVGLTLEIEKLWKEVDLYIGVDDLEEYENFEDYFYGVKVATPAIVKKTEEKEYLPSVSQSVINMLMKNMSNRGIMGWHSTGSGKTCTATGVMEAAWESGKQIIFASSIDAIASNPPFKFHECAQRLFPRFKGKPMADVARAFESRGIFFKTFAVLSNNVKKVEKLKKSCGVKSSNVHSDRDLRVSGSKYNQMLETAAATWNIDKKAVDSSNMGNKKDRAYVSDLTEFMDLDNAVLIIDEVHNLFRPLAHQREQHQFLEKHLVDPTLHPKLKVVILTATPGDNVPDVMKLLNIIRDPSHPVIKPPNPEDATDILRFKKEVRGMVSYFDMSNDRTKFPRVLDLGPVKYPMSNKQFAQYLEKYKEIPAEMKDYDKLAKGNKLSKFWQGARKYANMLYQFDKTLQLTEFSSKLPALLEKIQMFPKEKQYCYSAFYTNQGSGHGILEIARQLTALGYTKLTVAEAKAANKAGRPLAQGKRFILAIQSEIGESGTSSAGKNLHEMVEIYNSEANKNGELVHVFLASQSFNEGLDLKAVRHIHIFEPLVTMASDLQTIGRARRFCSHAHLPQSQWTVQIHRYFSDFPIDVKVSGSSTLQMEVTDLEGIVSDLDTKVKAEKEKSIKKALREAHAEKKKRLTTLKKELKAHAKMNVDNVHNIDEFIYNEAQRKMKELFVTYHSMKEASVDCMLLKQFHNDPSIHCVDETIIPKLVLPFTDNKDAGLNREEYNKQRIVDQKLKLRRQRMPAV